MTDGSITLNPGVGGDILDTESIDRADGATVERERIVIAGPGVEQYLDIDRDGAALVRTGAKVTQSGSVFGESFRDDIEHIFSRDQGAIAITKLTDLSTGGTATHDPTEGRVDIATDTSAGSVAYFESDRIAKYEAGHVIRGEQTILVSPALTGDEEVRWGYGEDDGSNDILNGIGWGADATGLFVWRRKAGSDEVKVYDSGLDSPSGLNPSTANHIYVVEFEWLGAAPPEWSAQVGRFIGLNHVEDRDAATGTTVPEPRLPLFIRVKNDSSSGRALTVSSGSWRGGVYTSKTVLTAQQPDGDYVDAKADGLARDVDGVDLQTTTTLGPSATYQSGWVDTDGWGTIEMTVASDVVSATDGIVIEFTDDSGAGTPTVRSSVLATFSAVDVAQGYMTFRVTSELDGFRVRYINGGTGQASFFLSVTLRTDPTQPTRSLKANLDPTSQAVITRSTITAPDDSGAWENVSRAAGGGLRVAVNEFEADVDLTALTTFTTNQANVPATAVQLVTAPLTDRKTVIVKNLSTSAKTIFIGTSSAVTASSGYELAAGEGVELDLDPTGTGIWAISSSGTQRATWLQIGGT